MDLRVRRRGAEVKRDSREVRAGCSGRSWEIILFYGVAARSRSGLTLRAFRRRFPSLAVLLWHTETGLCLGMVTSPLTSCDVADNRVPKEVD